MDIGGWSISLADLALAGLPPALIAIMAILWEMTKTMKRDLWQIHRDINEMRSGLNSILVDHAQRISALESIAKNCNPCKARRSTTRGNTA